MSAEVKYMWKLEFSNSRVSFHWDFSFLLGKFMCLHFYSVTSGSEKLGCWGWSRLVEIKSPGGNWWNNFFIKYVLFLQGGDLQFCFSCEIFSKLFLALIGNLLTQYVSTISLLQCIVLDHWKGQNKFSCAGNVFWYQFSQSFLSSSNLPLALLSDRSILT